MKFAHLVAAAGLLAAPLANAAPADEVAAPIHQFIDAFNKGDDKTAESAFVPGPIAIVDEFPPYRWAGAAAYRDWNADYAKDSKAKGVTDPGARIDEPTRVEVEGDHAYLIVPELYTFKQNGKPMSEAGQVTYILRKEPSGWKIAAWTWTGPKPSPAP